MNKTILTLILSSFILMVHAQSPLKGKTYLAEINASCKKMTGGGCMIYTYCILKFEKDSVAVSYKTKSYCVPAERDSVYNNRPEIAPVKYKWSIENNVVTIEKFDNYGNLKIEGAKLIGKNKLNDKVIVEFQQEE